MRIMISLLAFCMATSAVYSKTQLLSPEDEQAYLYFVSPESHTEIGWIELANLRSLTFASSSADQTLQANLKDGSIKTYDLNQVGSMYFGYTSTGINELTTAPVLPYIKDEKLYAGQLPDNTPATIYSIDGRVVKQFLLSTITPTPVSDLPNGLYILSTNGQAHKLLKR